MIILELFISLFVDIMRSDFIGIIVSIGILVIYNTSFNREPFKNINRFLIVLGGDIIYDLLWILINMKVY